MARVIVITSGKGGVGKTAITANLGVSLALLGERVCLIDADLGLTNLDITLGLTNRIVYNMKDYVEGKCRLDDIIYKDKRFTNLSFIPGCTDGSYETVPVNYDSLLTDITPYYDFILIDSPSGIETGFMKGLSIATEAIIVTTPSHAAIRDADRVIGLIEDHFNMKTNLIINMFKPDTDSSECITHVLNIDLLGVIQHDVEVIRSIHAGIPIALNSELDAGFQFQKTAQRLVNNSVMEAEFEHLKTNPFLNKWHSLKRLFSKFV